MFWKKKPPDPYLQNNVDALIDKHRKLSADHNDLWSEHWAMENELQTIRSRIVRMEVIRNDTSKTAQDLTKEINDQYVKAWSTVDGRDNEIKRLIHNVLGRMLDGN